MEQPEYRSEEGRWRKEAGFAKQKQSRRRSRCGKGGNTEKEEGEEQGGIELRIEQPKTKTRIRGDEESSQFVNVKICECENEIQGDCQRCVIAADAAPLR